MGGFLFEIHYDTNLMGSMCNMNGMKNPPNSCQVDFLSISMNMWSLFSEEKAGAEVLVNQTGLQALAHFSGVEEVNTQGCSVVEGNVHLPTKNQRKMKIFFYVLASNTGV